MLDNIPSAEAVRLALAQLTMRQLGRLAELSSVPMATIYKIKLGETKNPGVETVRMFLPHIAQVLREAPVDMTSSQEAD